MEAILLVWVLPAEIQAPSDFSGKSRHIVQTVNNIDLSVWIGNR